MIVFEPLGPLWLEILVFAGTLAVLGFSLAATRHQPLKTRLLVGGLRTLLLASALLLLHQPTLTRRVTIPQEQRLAVLIDRSGSMGSEAGDGMTRYETAYQLLNKLDGDVRYDVFEFDQLLSESLGQAATPRKLSGGKTDFYQSMTQFLDQSDDYTSVLLLSDGHDLGRFSQMSGDETERWLSRLDAPPINTVMVGQRSEGPEITIHSIDAPSFSFVRAPLRIRATILVRNLDNHATQVQLLDGEQIIKIQDLVLDDQGFGTVEFEYYPEQEGEHLFTVMVPAHHLERNVENNRQQVLIDIGRDKISVLHIAGSITWDLQGLRDMYERDPLVDLTAFYIMRTREHNQVGVDNRQISHEEMALVPFPTEEIFDRQLFSFDVVVFQDFDAATYFSDSYQARRLFNKIRQFVTEHRGGFLVIGGPRTAEGPSLGLTPLADILPLVPPVQRLAYEMRRHQPRRTEEGNRHPILRRFDADFQAYAGAMEAVTVNKHASVLVRDQADRPLLAVSEPGNGRTLFLNTSSSWQWRRDALAAGRSGENYYDFWSQTLKWMVQDPTLNEVRISSTKKAGKPLELEVDLLLRDQKYEPAASVNAGLVVTALDDKSKPRELVFTTDDKGRARVTYTADRPGYYRLWLREDPWRTLSRPHTVFLGGSQDELRNQDLVPETLQRLATYTNGRFSDGVAGFQAANMAAGTVRQQTVVETRRLKLRNWIWCLPMLLLIATIEWWVRRSRHLA